MSFCTNCGTKLEDDAKFCEACGTAVENKTEAVEEAVPEVKKEEPMEAPRKADPVTEETEAPAASEGRTVGGSGEIKLCADGKYRWVYEFPMMKNPSILFTVWNVLAISSGIVGLFLFFVSLGDGFVEAVKTGLTVFGILMGIFIVVGIIGYIITAAAYGWKYIVLFVMDEDSVSHIMQDKQFKKAQGIAWLNFMAGAATKDAAKMGRGLLVATKNSSTSDFKNVKKVIGQRGRNTIKVNQLLSKNQVYCDKRDYDFVYDFIKSHCPNAKIK